MWNKPLAETLENRRLLSINLTDGVLALEGTDAADTITLTVRGGVLNIRVGADRATANIDEVDEVIVSGLGGNDRITLGKLNVSAIVDGGDGDDRISGGRASDIITGGEGNDRISGGAGDDELFGGAGNDRVLGDSGNDDLSGGEGADLLNGGLGFDTTDVGSDIVTGVEDGSGILNPFDPTFEDGFGLIFTNGSFVGFRNTPLDTTGLNPTPGSNVISPLLSSNPAGNVATSNPFTGVTLQAGGVFVNLPNTGAPARSLSLSPGNRVEGWASET
jgi:Ca2+-binding RTX toxin-like protein